MSSLTRIMMEGHQCCNESGRKSNERRRERGRVDAKEGEFRGEASASLPLPPSFPPSPSPSFPAHLHHNAKSPVTARMSDGGASSSVA
jgi:hypothetical protein